MSLHTQLLYAQKLWSFMLPKVIAGDKETEPMVQNPYLVAFASLLPLVPASLYLSDLATVRILKRLELTFQILPLLLRSLSLPDPVQRTNVITALTSIIETTNSSAATDTLLHEHAESMVDGLLRSALRVPDEPSTGVSSVIQEQTVRGQFADSASSASALPHS